MQADEIVSDPNAGDGVGTSSGARFRDLFHDSTIRTLVAGSVVGRSSASMISVGLVLLVQDVTGSFALAGSAAGGFSISVVAAGLVRSWIIVRLGHRRSLLMLSVTSALALSLSPLIVVAGRPSWEVVALAVVVGATSPPFGALMRVSWSRALPQHLLSRAFGLDSVCEEVTLVVGPLVVGAVVAAVGTRWVLPSSGGLCLVGALAMAFGAKPAPALSGAEGHRSIRAAARDAIPILVALAGIGLTVGTVEVGVPALAERFHHLALAGPLLGVLSGASAGGAFFYGRRTRRAPLTKWLFFLGLATTVSTALLAAPVNVPTLVPLLLVAGSTVGPAVMTGYLLADRFARGDAAKTHAAILASVACNGGAAAGAAAAGLLVGAAGAPVAFLVVAIAATVLTALSGLWRSGFSGTSDGGIADPVLAR